MRPLLIDSSLFVLFTMEEQIFPATLDSLQPIRDYVSRVAGDAGLDPAAIYDLCLAVDEIATNVVLHGYEEAGLSGNLKISAEQQAGMLIVHLEDHGKVYDPNAHELPTEMDLQTPLEERHIGGLGIFLAKTSVQDLQYTAGESGNVHRFVMALPKASQ
jgi:serine/threonine-protein kinase RsbW